MGHPPFCFAVRNQVITKKYIEIMASIFFLTNLIVALNEFASDIINTNK